MVHLAARAPWGDHGPATDGLIYRAASEDPDPPVVEATWVAGRPGIRVRYADGVEFHLREDAREAWVSWPDALSVADAQVYLLGPVLGFVLRRLGVLALHASAAVIGERAAAFCGLSGAGKSTVAAAAAAAGHAILADDILALREAGNLTLAFPAADHLRVWDDAARMIVGEGVSLPRLAPNWDKRAFPLEALGFSVARAPVPLGAIFLLADRSTAGDAPLIEPLRAAEAFVPLVANTSANYLLSAEMRAQEFVLLARVLAKTPVFRLVPSADPARLPDLVARVKVALGA